MADVLIIGGGLAGLAAGLELARAGKRVHLVEARPHLGGRTASWDEHGMLVESGLHRILGFYRHLPKLMTDAGIDLNKTIIWEDEIEIRIPDGPTATYGASLPRRPLQTIWSLIGPIAPQPASGTNSASPQSPCVFGADNMDEYLPISMPMNWRLPAVSRCAPELRIYAPRV